MPPNGLSEEEGRSEGRGAGWHCEGGPPCSLPGPGLPLRLPLARWLQFLRGDPPQNSKSIAVENRGT